MTEPDQDCFPICMMTLSIYCDIMMVMKKKDGQGRSEMKTIRTLLSPFRVSGRRYDRYYQGVIGPGSGYPTYDEARRDIINRERSLMPQAGWR